MLLGGVQSPRDPSGPALTPPHATYLKKLRPILSYYAALLCGKSSCEKLRCVNRDKIKKEKGEVQFIEYHSYMESQSQAKSQVHLCTVMNEPSCVLWSRLPSNGGSQFQAKKQSGWK